MLKHAETGTGGIPRRAFNNPRAMESLGSSNLSNSFALGDTSPSARLGGRELPALNTRGFVQGKERLNAVKREMQKDIRAIQKALPTLDPDSIGSKTLRSREATLRQEVEVLNRQVRQGGYLNTPAANRQANPNGNFYVPKEYADRAGINTTRSF
jgi:hypothetical protein